MFLSQGGCGAVIALFGLALICFFGMWHSSDPPCWPVIPGEIFLPKPKSGTDGGGKKRGDTEVVPEGERVGRRNRSLQRGQTDVGSALDRLFDDVPFPFNLAGGLVKARCTTRVW